MMSMRELVKSFSKALQVTSYKSKCFCCLWCPPWSPLLPFRILFCFLFVCVYMHTCHHIYLTWKAWSSMLKAVTKAFFMIIFSAPLLHQRQQGEFFLKKWITFSSIFPWWSQCEFGLKVGSLRIDFVSCQTWF